MCSLNGEFPLNSVPLNAVGIVYRGENKYLSSDQSLLSLLLSTYLFFVEFSVRSENSGQIKSIPNFLVEGRNYHESLQHSRYRIESISSVSLQIQDSKTSFETSLHDVLNHNSNNSESCFVKYFALFSDDLSFFLFLTYTRVSRVRRIRKSICIDIFPKNRTFRPEEFYIEQFFKNWKSWTQNYHIQSLKISIESEHLNWTNWTFDVQFLNACNYWPISENDALIGLA